jgi:hypothetical protein
MKVKVFRNVKAILGNKVLDNKVKRRVKLDMLLDLYEEVMQVALNANVICEIKDRAGVRNLRSDRFNQFIEVLKEKGDKTNETL